MAYSQYTSPSVPVSDKSLSGGLNSTAGPMGLKNNESSGLQNIDFDKFGSIISRSGYTALNTTWIDGSETNFGLHWFEYDSSGTTMRKAITVCATSTNFGKVYKMDGLDGTWDDISGVVTIPNKYCDFTNFLNEVYVTAENTAPFKWNGAGNCSLISTPSNLQWAKYNTEYENYLFLGNVKVAGSNYPSRFYWSTIKNTGSWTGTNFIAVAKDDGEEITRLKPLGDRLVVYKSRSIYNVFFTGDSDIPFIVKRSNSEVGCVAPFSIQEVNNGHVFLSYDGFYFYDGINSIKISDRVTSTLLAYNRSQFIKVSSLVQKDKNRYWCAFTLGGATENSRVLVWDYYNNAWSIYAGLAPSTMATFLVNGLEERPYFADYEGYVYRGDTGDDDYPLNTQTAISSHYYTNWRDYDDLVDKKGIPHVYIYYPFSTCVLTFAYSYDLEDGDTYSQSFNLATAADVYGTGLYGTAVYAGEGGEAIRRDLTGRGRLVRFKFANSTIGESYRIDGIGALPHLETLV